ncbi:hypothetical protein LGH70_22900 [Hymenobacter sp. BT635]|uniref:Uncharacterized protein n=1 Tax=Hymenobacter nitidus TaxID=2880929 RepID=A0ABS8AJ55_9BACT|nr:hypothetical protein [Hymenobacter nitidus]MCB2380460.1 hypothetical protein [Hymenobacter nitidus]
MKLPISLFLLAACFLPFEAAATADSLTVFMWGVGPKREAYRVYYDGKRVLSTPRGGAYLDSFQLPSRPNLRAAGRVDVFITRVWCFGLFERSIGLGIAYDPNRRYLVVKRDPQFKKSEPLTFYWTDEKPRMRLM